MVTRDHNNRSEQQKGHTPDHDGKQKAESQGHQASAKSEDRSGTDERHDGKSRNDGGGDGAGGAPKKQGQGQANKGVDNHHQNRGHS